MEMIGSKYRTYALAVLAFVPAIPVENGLGIPLEVRELIFRMVVENPTWGAPRIHGELLMLGFDLSERSISRWMKRAPKDPDRTKRWLAFLRNHREAIVAMDFFTVPTITLRVEDEVSAYQECLRSCDVCFSLRLRGIPGPQTVTQILES
jgi:hypothetical protein